MTGDTLMLRQIHPNFIQNGRVTSQAFRPTPKDESRLSVDNGDMITPEACWKRFTAQRNTPLLASWLFLIASVRTATYE